MSAGGREERRVAGWKAAGHVSEIRSRRTRVANLRQLDLPRHLSKVTK